MHYTIATFVFLALFLFNHEYAKHPLFGLILLGWFFLFYGNRLGTRLLPKSSELWRTFLGALSLLCSITIIGTVLYYIAFLPSELWIIFVLLTPVAVWLIAPQLSPHPFTAFLRAHLPSRRPPHLPLLILTLLLLVGIASLLSQTHIYDAVRSTWERMPPSTIWLFGLLYFTLATLTLNGNDRQRSLPLLIGGFFFTIAIAVFVYPHGFGFDSFLHQTTEQHIAEYGTIEPKPFYYIGQYVNVLFLSEGFRLPLLLVDRYLLIVLSALLIPLAWLFASVHLATDKRSSLFSVLGVFLLPLAGFIVTTPQSLANLFTLVLVLLSLPRLSHNEGPTLRALWLLGVAITAIHPLAGIPALLYLVLLTIQQHGAHLVSQRVSNTLFISVALIGCVSLPLVFIVNALVSGLPLSFSLSALSPLRLIESLNIDLIVHSSFNLFLDVAYLFQGFAFPLLILLTTWILIRTRHLPHSLRLPALMAGILLINYIVLTTAVEFTFLIDYERGNYSERLLTLAFFFLTPYLLIGLAQFGKRLHDTGTIERSFALLLLTAMMTSSLYLAYPRRDNQETSHGFNTGTADILAVEEIEKTGPADFIVLANQQVSAAAVSKYGFKAYYNDLFYYPIPTGGALYQSFLKMNEQPSRATIEEALRLADVRTGYYVVNDYWWQSERLIETAKTEANDWFALDNGKVHVFRYDDVKLQ